MRWILILFPKFLAKTKQNTFLQTKLKNSGNSGFLHHSSKNNLKCKIRQLFSSESFVNLSCCLAYPLCFHCFSFPTPPAANVCAFYVVAVLKNAVSILSFICLLLACVLGDSPWLNGLPRFPKATHLLQGEFCCFVLNSTPPLCYASKYWENKVLYWSIH